MMERQLNNDQLNDNQLNDNQLNDNQLNNDQANIERSKLSSIVNSTLLIIALTLIFGAISYALIEVNNAVFQLSIAEGLWCGLAMALATGYYLLHRSKKKPTENQDQ